MAHTPVLGQAGGAGAGGPSLDGSLSLDGPATRLCGISARGWLALLAAAAFLVPVVFAMWRGPTYFDDAYMFHRYALHVRDGLGIAWNPDGIQTYGLTSQLWLAVVLVGSFLPVHPGHMLQIASALAALAAFAIMTRAVSANASSRWLQDPAVAAAAVSLPLLASTSFAYHLTSGMDTMLSMAMHGLIIVSVLRYMAEPGLERAVLVGLCAFAAVLTRPENGLCALGVPFLAFLAQRRFDRWRDLAGLVVLPSVLIAAFFALCWLVYGTPLPLSFYAKSLHAYAGFQNPENAIRYLALAISFGLVYVIVLAATMRRRDLAFILVFLLPALATFAYLATLRQVMGWQGRYYLPFLPYLILPALLMLDRALADAGRVQDLPRRFGLAAGIVGAVVGGWLLVRSELQGAYLRLVVPAPIAEPVLPIAATAALPKVEWFEANVTLSDHVAGRLPQGAVMAASEVGYLGSRGRGVTIIDLVGLNDTTIGRRGFSMDYLLSRKPDVIWLPHNDYTGLRALMLADRRLFDHYEVYAGAFNYGLAVRRDSPDKAAVDAAIAGAWLAVYRGRRMADYLVRTP